MVISTPISRLFRTVDAPVIDGGGHKFSNREYADHGFVTRIEDNQGNLIYRRRLLTARKPPARVHIIR